MLKRDDLIDLIVRHLTEAKPASVEPSIRNNVNEGQAGPAAPKGRLFLSEHDIKKRLTPGQTRLTIPKESIISPLAADWLVLQGIQVIRE